MEINELSKANSTFCAMHKTSIEHEKRENNFPSFPFV